METQRRRATLSRGSAIVSQVSRRAHRAPSPRMKTHVQDALVSPHLYRPTRIIARVDSTTDEGYVRLNQYKLMEEIGQASARVLNTSISFQCPSHPLAGLHGE